MIKARFFLAFFCLVLVLPLRAFDWETATSNGREYVSLHSFCLFYGFPPVNPMGNDRYVGRNTAGHSVSLKVGSSDMYLDGVHYVMSFPIESNDHDWLVSRMDVIKLFEPVLRPTEISGRHAIRGVVIDPGHGGSDNGATSRYGAEKDYTRDTAFRLDEILRDAGLKTVLTRRSDVFVDLYERAHIASLYPDYCFVSIHYNSAMEEARGLETYCLSPRGAASTSSNYLSRSDIQKLPGNDYDTLNILLASMVHSEIIKLNPGDSSADRGVKRARFVVIKQNVLPAILVEGGFVSNRMESARVNRPDYRQSLAEAIARGIIKFVNVMGDRNMQLPGMDLQPSSPPPRAIPVAPMAPSGLANDPANATTSTHGVKPGTSATTMVSPTNGVTGTTPKTKKKSKKDATTVVTPAIFPVAPPSTSATPSGPIPAPPETPGTPAPTPTEATNAPAAGQPAQSPRSPLDLSEPTAPTPTPGMDKSPAEPDEPPTVNIYPTPPPTSAKSAPAPEVPAPAASPAPPSSPVSPAPTNAAPTTPPPGAQP